MTQTHSTIQTSGPDDPILRHECPACGFVLELAANGVGALIAQRGDASVGHTWPGQGHLVLR
jgi:hypothetical protein